MSMTTINFRLAKRSAEPGRCGNVGATRMPTGNYVICPEGGKAAGRRTDVVSFRTQPLDPLLGFVLPPNKRRRTACAAEHFGASWMPHVLTPLGAE